MAAYYNEIDPLCAEVLKELMKMGVIAYGDVDTRSIQDVVPNEIKGYTQYHFFAGIGIWSYAFKKAGWPDDIPVISGSCPCQPFSSAGKGEGFTDERHLWPAFFHHICHGKPRAIPVFGEQVASKDGLAWLDLVQADLEGQGYAVGASDTCSAGFGAPHIRQRLYWVGFVTLGNTSLRGCVRGEVGNEAGPQCPAPRSRENEGCWWHDVADDGACVRLADADNQLESATRNSQGVANDSRPSLAGGLAHSDRPRHEGDGLQPLHGGWDQQREIASPSGLCAACWLADSGTDRLQGRVQRGPDTEREAVNGQAGRNGTIDRLAYPDNAGRQLLTHAEPAGICGKASCQSKQVQQPSADSSGFRAQHPGPTNGFWRDVDWLLCKDGKWRPTQSLPVKVADGLAHRLGYSVFHDLFCSLDPLKETEKEDMRIGRLRGYGNGLNAVHATEFIRACMACMDS